MRSEFDFIQNIKNKYGLAKIGDDCAVLPKDDKTDMVVTADMLVEDIDFRLDWTTPELLGAKTLAVSLSDIAAMGATPTWAMLSLGITKDIWNSDFVDRFYEGWFALAKHHNVELVGGDVSRIPKKIVFDSIVAGEIPKGKAILRSGAKPGDSIFVTGDLGGASGGLMMLDSGFRYGNSNKARREMIAKQLRPISRIQTGKYLLEHGIATAMIDLSDGLSSDLHHLCAASWVGARIDAKKVPICPALFEISATRDQGMEFALNGGEDFELLFTSQEKKISHPELPEFFRIGEVTANNGIIEVTDVAEIVFLSPKGYRHF
ncbi:MAG: thiamine-phosphate kinase [Pyrinomonadaceae bacterium]